MPLVSQIRILLPHSSPNHLIKSYQHTRNESTTNRHNTCCHCTPCITQARNKFRLHNSIRCGDIPVSDSAQNAKSERLAALRSKVKARHTGCDHKTAQPMRNEQRCCVLRTHQVTPESSTTAGQFTPGSDL